MGRRFAAFQDGRSRWQRGSRCRQGAPGGCCSLPAGFAARRRRRCRRRQQRCHLLPLGCSLQPDIATIHTDFTSSEGIRNYVACKLGSFRTAEKRVDKAQQEVLPERNLFAAKGSFDELKIQAKCRGSKDEVYEVRAEFESQMGEHIDWAECTCSCLR